MWRFALLLWKLLVQWNYSRWNVASWFVKKLLLYMISQCGSTVINNSLRTNYNRQVFIIHDCFWKTEIYRHKHIMPSVFFLLPFSINFFLHNLFLFKNNLCILLLQIPIRKWIFFLTSPSYSKYYSCICTLDWSGLLCRPEPNAGNKCTDTESDCPHVMVAHRCRTPRQAALAMCHWQRAFFSFSLSLSAVLLSHFLSFLTLCLNVSVIKASSLSSLIFLLPHAVCVSSSNNPLGHSIIPFASIEPQGCSYNTREEGSSSISWFSPLTNEFNF